MSTIDKCSRHLVSRSILGIYTIILVDGHDGDSQRLITTYLPTEIDWGEESIPSRPCGVQIEWHGGSRIHVTLELGLRPTRPIEGREVPSRTDGKTPISHSESRNCCGYVCCALFRSSGVRLATYISLM